MYEDEMRELRDLHAEMLEKLEYVKDCIAIIATVPGKRYVEGLEKDLSAVRRKYSGIKNEDSDKMLRQLCLIQGREAELDEQLRSFSEAEDNRKLLTAELEKITVLVNQKEKENTNGREHSR